MPWHIGTAPQCRAARDRLHLLLGYPRALTEGDRVGFGVHVAVADLPPLARWAFIARLSDGTFGLRVKPRGVRHLTAAQEARVVAELPEGVTVVREDED